MKNKLLIILLIFIVSCKNEKTQAEKNNIGYFRFAVSDTLAFGKNLARISEYKRDFKDNQSSLITVFVKNESEDGVIKIDTFSDGLKTPFFGRQPITPS